MPRAAPRSTCDTLGVNPGERWDVLIRRRPSASGPSTATSFPTPRASDGMFGMVNTMIVVPEEGDVDAIVKAIVA